MLQPPSLARDGSVILLITRGRGKVEERVILQVLESLWLRLSVGSFMHRHVAAVGGLGMF